MKIKTLVSTLLTASLLLAPTLVLAQGLVPIPEFQGTARGDLIIAITRIVNFVLILAALIAAIYLIIGGVRYIISQGDEGAAETAKNTILYAIIGLVVIGLSAVIVNFVVRAINAASNG